MRLWLWILGLYSACCDASANSSHTLSVGGAGWALQFDGENDFAILTKTMPPPPLTVEMWVYPLSSVNGQGEQITKYVSGGTLLSKYSVQGGRNLWSVQYNGRSVWTYSRTFSNMRSATVVPDDGTLFHWALTLDNRSQFTVYIDGEPVRTGSHNALDVEYLAGKTMMAAPWMIGARMIYQGGLFLLDDRCFGGYLDELRWWNVALSQQEIHKWMEVSPKDNEPGLFRRWSFDEREVANADPLVTGISKGGGDISRSPKRVPSTMSGLIGGPLAVDAFRGAPPQPARICAAIVPPANGTIAYATFGNVVGSTGRLVAAGQTLRVDLTPTASYAEQKGKPPVSELLCGMVHFLPTAQGEEALPFNITAVLPAAVGGGTLESTSQLDARVTENLPPTAGRAKAVSFDGRSSYASMGIWDLPSGEYTSHWSFSYWLMPDAVIEDTWALSLHLSRGKNLVLFGFYGGGYEFRTYCRAGCNGGNIASGTVNWPRASNGASADSTVFPSGKTGAMIKAERNLAHLLTVTFHCYTRGNDDPVNNPARSRITMYVDGYSIGEMDGLPACVHSPIRTEHYSAGTSPGNHPAPWELGAEYDGGPADVHLPGVSVTASNFFPGIFDDLRFWSRELTAAEVLDLARGGSPAESDIIVHYSFDHDDRALCEDRQLADGNITCHGLNEGQGRAVPTERFTFTNALIGTTGQVVNSPFYQVPGSSIPRTVQAGTCEQVQLLGSDPNGDSLTFSLPSSYPGATLLSGGVLRYCAPAAQQASRVDVEVLFDACDPLGFCASGTSGLGRVIFHVLKRGPSISHFQVLPEESALRLIFAEPTNTPSIDTEEAIQKLVAVTGFPSGTDVLAGRWEEGATAMRLMLSEANLPGIPPRWLLDLLGSANATSVAGLSVQLKREGMLRDRANLAFPSLAGSPAVEVLICGSSMFLPPGDSQCRGCPPGHYASKGACRPCEPGFHQPFSGGKACLRCPQGSYATAQGAVSCDSCEAVLAGSSTLFQGSMAPADCVCPPGKALASASPGANGTCKACQTGLLCRGGLTGAGRHQPALQAEGFSAGAPQWEGGPPSYLVRCSSAARCPEGLQLGSCPPLTQGRSCAECAEGTSRDGERCEPCDGGFVGFIGFLVALAILVALGALIKIAATGIPSYFEAGMTVTISAALTFATLQILGVLDQVQIRWPQPIRALKPVFAFAVLQGDSVRMSCSLQSNDASFVYFMSLSAYPVIALLLSLGLFVGSVAGLSINRHRAINSHGMAINALYISITSLSIMPLMCVADNPDGSSSLVAYRELICWNNVQHLTMVSMGIIATLVFVVSFISLVNWAVWVYPRKVIDSDGIVFMQRYRFLFQPFRADCYYFVLWVTLRKLLVCLVPVLFPDHPQLQLIILLVVVAGGAMLQCTMWPWRAVYANYLDATYSLALILVLTVGFIEGDFEGHDNDVIVGWTTLISVLLIAVGAALCFGYAFIRAAVMKKRFSVYLCYDSMTERMLARWFKILLQEAGCVGVALSSDDLAAMDTSMDTVMRNSCNLVVLLSSETLTQVSCAMAIAGAHKAKINTVMVAPHDFTGFSEAFLDRLEEVWGDDEKNLMAANGILISHLRAAYDVLAAKPSVKLDRTEAKVEPHKEVVQAVLKSCVRVTYASPDGTADRATSMIQHAMKKVSLLRHGSERRSSVAGRGHTVYILGDSSNWEYACGCRILEHLVAATMDVNTMSWRDVMDQKPTQAKGRNVLLVALTYGILEKIAFARALVAAGEQKSMIAFVPLIFCEAFTIPADSFWERLENGELFGKSELECNGLTLAQVCFAYNRLFETQYVKLHGIDNPVRERAELEAICIVLKSCFDSASKRASSAFVASMNVANMRARLAAGDGLRPTQGGLSIPLGAMGDQSEQLRGTQASVQRPPSNVGKLPNKTLRMEI